MHTKLFTASISALFLLSILAPSISAEPVTIYLNQLNTQSAELMQGWKNNNSITIVYEGINFSLTNHFTRYELIIKEEQGRDVRLIANMSKDYILPATIFDIRSKNISISWKTYDDYAQISLSLAACGSVFANISKAKILKSKLMGGVLSIFNIKCLEAYPEKETDTQVIINISKSDIGYELCLKSLTVTYKTGKWGWFYPADTKISYNLTSSETAYKISIDFRNSTASPIRIYTRDVFTFKGKIGSFFLNTHIGIKKVVFDIFCR